MTDFSTEVLKELDHKISKLDRLKAVDHLISDEGRDFTRDRKLLFPDMIKTILSMAGKPVREELLDHFDYSADSATASAFVQARSKIEPEAFRCLFDMMNKEYPCIKTFKSYHLIAVDGSDLAISYNQQDEETYLIKGTDTKGCDLYHINATYDILENRYTDMILTTRVHEGEQALGKRKGGHPPDLEALVKAELLPVRPGRSDLRKIEPHSFVCFNYRFS